MRARRSCWRPPIWLRGNLDLFLGACIVAVLGAHGSSTSANGGRRASIVAVIARSRGLPGRCAIGAQPRIIGTLGLLVANGVALPAALKILRDVITEPRIVAAIDRVHEQVRNGRRFARRARR